MTPKEIVGKLREQQKRYEHMNSEMPCWTTTGQRVWENMETLMKEAADYVENNEASKEEDK